MIILYNLLIGGAAGQGIDTTAAILEKLLKRSGYHVFTSRDFMSRVRGGHNFSLIRFGTEPVMSHSDKLDGMIALNDETVELHSSQLGSSGFIFCDSKLSTQDSRAIKVDMEAMAKTIGNPRVMGSIALGAVLKIFGESLTLVEDVLKAFVDEKYFEINLKAVAEGYNTVESRFPRLNGNFSDWMILSGSKALALGAIAAGLKILLGLSDVPINSDYGIPGVP